MPTNNAKIFAALKTYLEAYTELPSVKYGGQSYTPPDAAEPYLIVDDVRFENERMYQDSGAPDWETGMFTIHVMTPLQWLPEQHAEYVGRIQDYFAKDTPIRYDGVTVRVAKRPSVVAGYRDGDRWRQVLSVAWEGGFRHPAQSH